MGLVIESYCTGCLGTNTTVEQRVYKGYLSKLPSTWALHDGLIGVSTVLVRFLCYPLGQLSVAQNSACLFGDRSYIDKWQSLADAYVMKWICSDMHLQSAAFKKTS